MSVFYVTALFLPSGEIFRPIYKYIQHFHELAESGIPLGVFLDERLRDHVEIIVGRFANVQILEYVAVDKSFLPATPELPTTRNEKKDTAEYLAIQLMKLNLCARIASRLYVPWIAWIDFGIFHMFRDKDAVKKFLLSYVPPDRCDKILNPGCWSAGSYKLWDSIAWRFCGSLLIGRREVWQPAYELQQKKVLDGLPRLTWEVNYWALMEEAFEWYKADHNDTIILNLPTI